MSTVIVALFLHQPQHETALKAYQQRRDELNSKYTQTKIQQTKQPTERQSQNWVSVAEIEQLITELDAEAMWTDGQTIYSYNLPIGFTRPNGYKICTPHTARNGRYYSQTTSQHSNLVARFSDHVASDF